MKLRTVLLPILFAVGLAGCFLSDGPLIDPQKAVFPYERIVYKEETSDDQLVLVHQGDAYLPSGRDSDANVGIRFLPVGDNLYLAEVKGVSDGKATYLHAILAVDPDKKTARSYAAVGDEKDAAPGLRACHDDICIDDVAAYVARAKAAIAAGGDPDAIYTIVEMK